MTKSSIQASQSAPVKGPYSPAIRCGNMIYFSGQIGTDPKTGTLAQGGSIPEFKQALTNLNTLLEAAGLTPADVVKTTVFLVDMADFAAMNEAYAAFFKDLPRPARSCVAVTALPAGARAEIEAVAEARA